MGRTNVELGMLKKTYYDMYGKDLGSVMDSELRGELKKAVLASLQAPLHDFDPAIHTPQRAKDDAEKLYKAGEGRMGTEEHNFINILVTRPPQHNGLSAALVRYNIVKRDIEPVFKAMYGKNLRDRIESEVSGDYGKLVLAVFDSPVP
ncbi:hypothetical protein PsorP6_015711 [Peronosclerospora sorghi]|uniref:Uncharacterized protein n=1 Tax=Peronosclerospora sorghi TaxID=230839 RepID=A0ACC0WPA4_9STRA|nr:hypothetical protein PsorP6_015711 [Peronosclerospora sorghi]